MTLNISKVLISCIAVVFLSVKGKCIILQPVRYSYLFYISVVSNENTMFSIYVINTTLLFNFSWELNVRPKYFLLKLFVYMYLDVRWIRLHQIQMKNRHITIAAKLHTRGSTIVMMSSRFSFGTFRLNSLKKYITSITFS